jgi:5-methylcytosine-specific restriction enzyme subunit McrC
MREISLGEYQTRHGVPLSTEERDLLRGLCRSLTIAPTVGEQGLFDLTASSEVGVIQLGDLSVEITPKLAIDRLLFLIAYSMGGVRFHASTFGFAREANLFESIIPGFSAQIRSALQRGLIQGYRVEEDALPGIRGRIRFDDQLRYRYGLFPPAEVRFDEFTEDIELNRLLKAALSRLRRMRIRSDLARRELHSFDGVMARVSNVEYGTTQIPDPSFNRLNKHYEPAVRLAQLILKSTSFEVRRGEVKASAFVVDMNRVFEDFVVSALRDALGLSPQTFPQGGVGKALRLDRARRIPLKPDISWWDGARCLFVGDVKYKRTASERVPNADLYQLLAYTVATDLPGGLLIYAAGEDEPFRHQTVNVEKVLEVVALDLAGSPSQVLDQITSLAETIQRMRQTARRRHAPTSKELGPALHPHAGASA